MTVYQERALVPSLSVAENLFVGKLPRVGVTVPTYGCRVTAQGAGTSSTES